MAARFAIAPARTDADFAAAVLLVRAYLQSLGVDISYQSPDAELLTMPGKYAPPGGELLIARLPDGTTAGCVALRPLDTPGCCEMKRLYVAPVARGLGIGAALVDAIIAAARAAGYVEMRLDSMGTMISARALYASVGFAPIAAYCENPFPDAVFLGLRLDRPAA